MHILGYKISSFIEGIFEPLQILPSTIIEMIEEKKKRKNGLSKIIGSEIYESGVKAVPLIIIFGIITGCITMGLFPFKQMSFGISDIYGSIFSTFLLRELAPLITALLVICRSSVAVCIQLSEMSLNGEVEALKIMGINPVQYLGTFKVLSGILIMPILTLYFSLASLISGMLTAFFIYNVIPDRYIFEILNTLNYSDLVVLYIKTVLFGFFIFAIAVYNGLFIKGDRSMIISSTVKTVIAAVFFVTALNFLISFLYYGS